VERVQLPKSGAAWGGATDALRFPACADLDPLALCDALAAAITDKYGEGRGRLAAGAGAAASTRRRHAC
jgi:hypothetical protein